MAQVPHADPGLVCPLHKLDMAEVCHKCPLWVLVRGTHPQTGKEVDNWNCSLAWLPVLMIENSQQQRATATAVSDFRNEVVKTNDVIVAAAQRNGQQRIRGD